MCNGNIADNHRLKPKNMTLARKEKMNMVAKMHLRLWETAPSSIKKFPASEIEWNTIRPKVQEKRLVYNIKGTHIVYNRAVPLFTCGLKVPGRIDVHM